MSDQDELRDRIAQTLYNHDVRTDYPGEPWIPDYYDANNRMRPEYEARAQAIIDELGLTVEEGGGYGYGRAPDLKRRPVEHRVVGKWEKQ